MKKWFFVSTLLFSTTASLADVVEFRIKDGTGRDAWNTPATIVTIKVGDTLRIINDDSIAHQLHTNGTPCGHGSRINPGASADCVARRPHDSTVDGPLYDHLNGPTAEFWLNAVQ